MTTFTDEIKARLDELILRYPTRQAALLPALWVAQEACGGWLPPEAMQQVAEYLELPRAEVEGVATFYTMYNKQPVGKHHIEICHNVSCQIFGADELIHHFEHRLGIAAGETTPDGEFTLNRAECLGACCNPVAIQVGGKYYEDVRSLQQADELLERLRRGERPAHDTPQAHLPEARQF